MTPDEPQTTPEEVPGTALEPAEEPEIPPKPSAWWTVWLTPMAVVLGSVIIGAAIWIVGRDDSNDDLERAIVDLQSQVAALGQVPASTAGDGGGVSTVQDLRTMFGNYAKQVGADESQFQACLSKQENIQLLNDHVQRGRALGVTGTPTFFINNKKLVGAQPQALFEEIINAELDGSPTDVTQYSASIQQLAATTPPRFEIMPSKVDLSGAQIQGPQNARVVIAEFSDLQCPFCKRWSEQTMGPLMKKYQGNVALAFLHFPITQLHPNAGNAAVAAICAGEQGKFWQMHDLLFARQDEWAALK